MFQFIYGTTDIPSVGKVELAWVNTPLPPVTPTQPLPGTAGKTEVVKPGEDTTMTSNDPPNGSNGVVKPSLNPHEDYDVAEEDEDRWIT